MKSTIRKNFFMIIVLLFISVSIWAGGKQEGKAVIEDDIDQNVEYITGTYPPLIADKPFAGTVITFPALKGWASFQPAMDLTPEFEEMTGITIHYVELPGSEIISKQLLELSQGMKTFDFVHSWASAYGKFFDYVVPIDNRIIRDWGSVDTYLDSFFELHQNTKGEDGKFYWTPFHANTQICTYQVRLFEDPKEQKAFKDLYGYELAPPETFEQFIDIASFFNRPEEGLYGFAANWVGGDGNCSFLHYYLASGFDLLDNNYMPTMRSPEGRAAALKIARWMQDSIYKDGYTAPDSISFSTGQIFDYFYSGSCAIAFGWLSDYWSFIQDNKSTSSIGDIGAFALPSPTGAKSGGYASWHVLGLNKYSEKKDACWEFIKWLLNEKQQLAMAGGQLPPIKEIAYKTSVEPGGIDPKALYDAFYYAHLPYQIPELSLITTRAEELLTSLLANMMTPEAFVDEFVIEIEEKLIEYGYIK